MGMLVGKFHSKETSGWATAQNRQCWPSSIQAQTKFNHKYTNLGLKHFQIKETVFVCIMKTTEAQICLAACVTGAVQVYSHGAMPDGSL